MNQRLPAARLTACLALALGAMVSASPAEAATSGANGTHDPSRMIESGGKFYVYSTGGGSKSSTDGLAWTEGPNLFPNGIPASLTSVVSNNEGVWAPDAIYLNSQYYIYYALANSGNACAVGLVTTPTLDPSSPSYKRPTAASSSRTREARRTAPSIPAPLWTHRATSGSRSGAATPSRAPTTRSTSCASTTRRACPPAAARPPGLPSSRATSRRRTSTTAPGTITSSGTPAAAAAAPRAPTRFSWPARRRSRAPTRAARFLESAGSSMARGRLDYDQCGADRFTYHYYPDTGGSVLGENELSWAATAGRS